MKDELLRKLEALEIDKVDASLPFSARLARENSWDRGFARRVVDEYKRFIWLAMRAGHPVTPSEEVDEAWHLHLCYTRSYWDEMCGGILGRPLHHGPTEGGRVEAEKFSAWYGRTLESYRKHFGEEPPADIWPPAEIRFRPSSIRKVDANGYWMIPRRVTGRLVAGALVTAVPLALAGCTNLVGAVGADGLFCFFGLFIFLIVMVSIARKGGGKGGSGCGSSGCGSIFGGSDDSGCGSSGCGSSGCGSGCGGCGGGD
ncbi:glycine-rich domain-containing protein [Luteolibacter marinus]|uniref:glycine-rich domain-containing protein n=1 Tax=Luteolibacter marinus TaxID=2776705 RepID=UPI001868549E|nr:hypothetical protein [Luteolibacter marinus]